MLVIVLLLISLALMVASYYFARVILYPKVFPFEETYRLELEAQRFVEEEYLPWEKEEIRIRSRYGYDLVGFYHPLPGSQKTVVISHGITWSRYGSIKYAALFRKRGYNVLIYDLRHHGLSGGKDTSFGFYEKEDLKTMVDWAFAHLDPGGIVGTLGESLGAATTLQHAGIDPRISFAVADCPYSDLAGLFAYRMKVEYHLPRFPLLNLADWWVKRLSGWTFAESSPMRFIPEIETPIFFVHGKNDDYIPPKMSIDMYRAKAKGYRKLYLAPNAGHAQSLNNNPIEYDQKIGEFLQEIGI